MSTTSRKTLHRLLLRTTAASTALGLAAALASVAPAGAAPRVSDPIAQGLVTPLQMDVSKGRVYVAQAFAGTIVKVRPNGSLKRLVREKGAGIGGVAVEGKTIAYTINDDEGKMRAALKVRKPNGKKKRVADIQRFEERRNPDARNAYGFLDLTPECAQEVNEKAPDVGGLPYDGIVDTNPYALADRPGGGWFVADAGANAIFRVSKRGRIRTHKVLPPQNVVVTEAAASALELPDCVVGKTYAFEPVPTDVEVAPDGDLYVSLLPGGPESPVLGARGSVVRIEAKTKAMETVATGFFAATNLALDDKGRVYVTEMFGDRVSVVRNGAPRGFVDLPMPGAVEFHDGKLYVATSVLDEENGGSIVTVRR